MVASTMPIRGKLHEPAWRLATLYPNQGTWSENEYHALETNHLVEFTDGFVEVLEMPNMEHQDIVHYLFRLLDAFVLNAKLGKVYMAPTKLRIRPDKVREPNVMFLSAAQPYRRTRDYVQDTALVMEVVSPDHDSHKRDWLEKVADYAEGGVSEYWIIDPQDTKIVVLRLTDGSYVTHSEAGPTGVVASALLEGFEVHAESVWAAVEQTQ